jgi:hypothetical protein
MFVAEHLLWAMTLSSVADPDPGSGAFFNRFFSDLGSRISDPKPIFLRAW